jgi:hypothetical protein
MVGATLRAKDAAAGWARLLLLPGRVLLLLWGRVLLLLLLPGRAASAPRGSTSTAA